MFNLEKVNGIILHEDGIPHSFGKNKMVKKTELSDDYYHDPTFRKEIVPSSWFQSLNYPYDVKGTLRGQAMNMCANGFTIILNDSSLNTNLEENYVYTIQVPYKISPETRDYLSSIYGDLKKLITLHDALFFAEPYDENGEYVWNDSSYSLDDFYDRMNIPHYVNKK